MRRLNLLTAMALASVVALPGCSDDKEGNGNGGITDPPPPTGSLELTIVTTGEDLDADGYMATLNCGCFENVGCNAIATMTEVEVGSHMVLLTDIAANCEVTGPNPRWVNIEADETAEVTFSVVCHGNRG